jgi:hypothetical protein
MISVTINKLIIYNSTLLFFRGASVVPSSSSTDFDMAELLEKEAAAVAVN